MEQTPKYYKLDRRTVGNMGAAKRVLDNLTRFSIAGSGISAFATSLVGGKIDLILPILAALIGLFTTTIRDLFSFIIDAAVIRNPINYAQTETISQPSDNATNPETTPAVVLDRPADLSR